MDFFPHVEINEGQAEGIARGLYSVARVDGVHEREVALIAQFYGDATNGQGTNLAELGRLGDVDGAYLAALLPTKEHRDLFVKTAWLLAYADGAVSGAERKCIASFSTALGLDAAGQAKLEASVKDFLMMQLAGLHNTDAVQRVAKKLG